MVLNEWNNNQCTEYAKPITNIHVYTPGGQGHGDIDYNSDKITLRSWGYYKYEPVKADMKINGNSDYRFGTLYRELVGTCSLTQPLLGTAYTYKTKLNDVDIEGETPSCQMYVVTEVGQKYSFSPFRHARIIKKFSGFPLDQLKYEISNIRPDSSIITDMPGLIYKNNFEVVMDTVDGLYPTGLTQ